MEICETTFDRFLLKNPENDPPFIFYQKIDELLKDLCLKIFYHVGPFDIKSVRLVNKHWKDLTLDKSLWKSFAQAYSVPIDIEKEVNDIKKNHVDPVNLINLFFQRYRREYTNIYFETEMLNILEGNYLLKGDGKYLYFKKISDKSQVYSFNPNSNKLSKSKYYQENKNYLKSVSNQQFALFMYTDKEDYCIDIFLLQFDNSIISFKDKMNNMFLPNFFLFKNKIFILTGKELQVKEITVDGSNFELNEKNILETDAIWLHRVFLYEEFLILGFKNGSMRIINKEKVVEEIENDDHERKFEINKIQLISNNILFVNYKKGSGIEENSYANFYKISSYYYGNFKTKLKLTKIYSTATEKNRYIYKSDVLFKDKIIIFNYDKLNKSTIIGAFSLISHEYFNIEDLGEDESFVNAVPFDKNLYLSLITNNSCKGTNLDQIEEKYTKYVTEKWTFYTFIQFLDHILENLKDNEPIDHLINQLTERDLLEIKAYYFQVNQEEQRQMTAEEFAKLPQRKIIKAIMAYKLENQLFPT